VIDVRGRTVGRIEGGGRGITEPAWSPDGRLLAFADKLDTEGNSSSALAVARPNLTNLKAHSAALRVFGGRGVRGKLVKGFKPGFAEGGPRSLFWSRDGHRLYFVAG
jgi:dipeptidyl aminopeptidase/acylaminoacyl peptidase